MDDEDVSPDIKITRFLKAFIKTETPVIIQAVKELLKCKR